MSCAVFTDLERIALKRRASILIVTVLCTVMQNPALEINNDINIFQFSNKPAYLLWFVHEFINIFIVKKKKKHTTKTVQQFNSLMC